MAYLVAWLLCHQETAHQRSQAHNLSFALPISFSKADTHSLCSLALGTQQMTMHPKYNLHNNANHGRCHSHTAEHCFELAHSSQRCRVHISCQHSFCKNLPSKCIPTQCAEIVQTMLPHQSDALCHPPTEYNFFRLPKTNAHATMGHHCYAASATMGLRCNAATATMGQR